MYDFAAELLASAQYLTAFAFVVGALLVGGAAVWWLRG